MTWAVGPCAQRCDLTEYQDSPTTTDSDLSRLFDYLDTLGRWAGGYRIILNFLESCSYRWTPGVPITILDLGCGRGDLARAISQWARRRNWEVRIHAVDKFGRAIRMARERHSSMKDITFDIRDLSDPLFLQAHQFDYVVSSLALHRENDERALMFLKVMNRLAKRGFCVSDWLRDVRGYVWMTALSRLYRSEAVRHDAGVSLRRGFTLSEMGGLAKKAGCEMADIRSQFGYRFSLSLERGTELSSRLQPWAGSVAT